MSMPVKSHASQGQQKSFAIALKLAQFEMLAARQQQKPLLLLDDIFDRLDDKRIARLLELVADETFGQVFLTDTNLERTDQALARVSSSHLPFSGAGWHRGARLGRYLAYLCSAQQ